MARPRIFSSRRMFEPRRTIFMASRPRRPLLRVLGFVLATALIFTAGFYVGRTFPHIFGSSKTAPVTAAEF